MAETRRAKQSEGTRNALLKVARRLFAARGYSGASVSEIVRRAHVTKGALYHHFAGKRDLFRAVCEDVERERSERIDATAAAEPAPERHLEAGCEAFLDGCMDPAIQQIILTDAPSVLGWEQWHEIESRYGFGLITTALRVAMDAGYIERQPVEPVSHLLLGALNEAGLAIARAEDPAKARAQLGAGVARLIDGLKLRQ